MAMVARILRAAACSAALATGLAGCDGGRAAAAPAPAGAIGRVERRPVEDVFLLSGELAAVRAETVVTPRSQGELQIRWMAEDGSDLAAGDRLIEFDAARVIQTIEERRLGLRRAEIERESRERAALAESGRKRLAVEKAEVEAEKARIDAAVPAELQPAVEWRRLQATWKERQAAVDKARIELDAWSVSSRADVTSARAAEEKARREVAAIEKTLESMSLKAPRAGIFLVGTHWQWGPEGPRKLQPGDTVWPGYPLGTMPEPGEMEVVAALGAADYGRIAVGMPARAILDSYPERSFAGRVSEIGSVAAEAGRGPAAAAARVGFTVRVALERTDPIMRPGLSVRVEVVRGSWPGALAVPRGAVRFGPDGPQVRRPEAAPVAVRVEACTPLECVLADGLAEGDRVVAW